MMFLEELKTYQTYVSINRLDPAIGVRYEKLGVNKLLNCKDNPILDFQPDSRPMALC